MDPSLFLVSVENFEIGGARYREKMTFFLKVLSLSPDSSDQFF
jgi:hypothetical protein